jgi:hypothetical protein
MSDGEDKGKRMDSRRKEHKIVEKTTATQRKPVGAWRPKRT